MRYLRFSSKEYQTLCRLSEQISLEWMAPAALQHFLVAHLPPQQLGLAKRIARLDNLQMRLLHEHLPGPNTDDATPDGWDGWDYVSTSSSPQPGRFGEFTVIAHRRQNG